MVESSLCAPYAFWHTGSGLPLEHSRLLRFLGASQGGREEEEKDQREVSVLNSVSSLPARICSAAESEFFGSFKLSVSVGVRFTSRALR